MRSGVVVLKNTEKNVKSRELSKRLHVIVELSCLLESSIVFAG